MLVGDSSAKSLVSVVRVSVGFLQKICLGKFSSFQEWVQYRLNRWHVSVCVLNCVPVLFSSFVFALILEMSEYGGLFCHNGWKNDFKEISSKNTLQLHSKK